ncbi:MAG: hypothetical protein ACLPKZ_07525 [Acidimicrobiales bacterium]
MKVSLRRDKGKRSFGPDPAFAFALALLWLRRRASLAKVSRTS